MTILFDKYVPTLYEIMKHRFKKITPIPDINHTEVLCKLLECLINPQNITSESPKDLYELYFVFACIWAYGSALFHDGTIDHRGEFSKWWLSEFKSVKFPPGSVFDFLVDPFNAEMVPWTTLVPKFELDPDLPLQSVLVHTAGIAIGMFLMLLICITKPTFISQKLSDSNTFLINWLMSNSL